MGLTTGRRGRENTSIRPRADVGVIEQPINSGSSRVNRNISELTDMYIDELINRFVNDYSETNATQPGVPHHRHNIRGGTTRPPQTNSMEEDNVSDTPPQTNSATEDNSRVHRNRRYRISTETSNTILPTQPPPSTGGPAALVDDLDSPVRIRPTLNDILYATELLNVNNLDLSANYQSHCPIDLNPFVSNENILRIKHCNHIFKESNLREHFLYSPRCPICRYDIREYVGNVNV
jgi:hypothetical protein